MSKPFRLASAVSLLALGSVIAGCAAPQSRTAPLSNFGGKQGEVGLATRALAALNSGDVPAAISLAERAVERTPNDAGFRTLLGNAYFAGGRFASAEAALKDSLSLHSNQPQAILKLALAEIALGKSNEAVAFLDAGRPVLDPSDYGLALALAGRTSDATAVLQDAARQPGADARVRQNLALALALSGDWTNARVVAGQDVPANQLDARIQQWMQLAKPAKASDQIAALVGVTPAQSDQGQPVKLALRAPEPTQAVASATVPLPPAQPAPAPAPQMAEVAPAPAPQPIAAVAEAAAPPPPPPPPPSALAFAAAVATDPEAAPMPTFVPARAPAPKKVRRVVPAAAPVRGASAAVMQLGSYRSPAYVTAAWSTLTKRYPALRAYLPMRARFDSPNGTFWRLSVQGFGSQREAIARCEALKNRGGSCFVRRFAGDKPVQYASR